MLRLQFHPDHADMLDVHRLLRFLRRNLLLVAIVALASAPVYYAAFQATRHNVIQESYSSFRTGFSRVDGMIQNLANLSDTISAEPSVAHLSLIRGEMSNPDYSYLLEAQNFLGQTLISDSMVKNTYCLFPGNRIFLSRTLTSPDWGTIYGTFLKMDGTDGNDWYQKIIGSSQRVTFAYQTRANWVFSPPTVKDMHDTVQVTIMPVSPGRLRPDSILVYMLDAEQLFHCFGSDEMMTHAFFYIADSSGTPVVRKGYDGKALALGSGIRQMKIGRTQYTVMQAQSEISGIRFVMGVPESYFAQEMQPLNWIIAIYAVLFCAVALAASVLLAVRQYSPLQKLMRSLKEVLTEPADIRTEKNEYGYIMNAVRTLDSKSRCYETELTFLSASMYNNMLERLLTGRIQTAQDEEQCGTMFGFLGSRFCVCALRLHGAEGVDGVEDAAQINAQVKDIIAQRLACPAYFYYIDASHVHLLLNLTPDSPDDRAGLVECMKTAVRSVHESLHIRLMCGVGTVCGDIRQINLSAVRAKDALRLSDEQTPVKLWCEPSILDTDMLLNSQLVQRLAEILPIGEPQYLEDFFGWLQVQLSRPQNLSEQQIRQAFYTMRNVMESAVHQLGGGLAPQLPEYSPQLGIQDLFRQFYEPARAICRFVQQCHTQTDDRQRRGILEYIAQNYSESNLCAQMIASHFLVSEKYVFTIVKNMTGQSLGDYLEAIRFQKVEDLLRSDVGINEIPQKVGYHSVNTFYKSFKRRYGMAPGKWREQVRLLDAASVLPHT